MCMKTFQLTQTRACKFAIQYIKVNEMRYFYIIKTHILFSNTLSNIQKQFLF